MAAEAVLDFWLREVGPARWYRADPALDAACRARFGDLWKAGAAGRLGGWLAAPDNALALCILLDQLPRNMHRGTARAFASDRAACAAAKRAIALGHDRRMPPPGRQFFYLPLMHAESLPDQDRCVRLCLLRLAGAGAEQLDHAVRHRAVIRLFGRFPSRNAALGRPDTPAERAYRAAGGYMG